MSLARRNKRAMPSEKFLKLAERISNYVDFRGCGTERCINRRIRRKNSQKLNHLINAGFAFRLWLESWINPHPIYKEMLGISDGDYNKLLEEKMETNKNIRKWKPI